MRIWGDPFVHVNAERFCARKPARDEAIGMAQVEREIRLSGFQARLPIRIGGKHPRIRRSAIPVKRQGLAQKRVRDGESVLVASKNEAISPVAFNRREHGSRFGDVFLVEAVGEPKPDMDDESRRSFSHSRVG